MDTAGIEAGQDRLSGEKCFQGYVSVRVLVVRDVRASQRPAQKLYLLFLADEAVDKPHPIVQSLFPDGRVNSVSILFRLSFARHNKLYAGVAMLHAFNQELLALCSV